MGHLVGIDGRPYVDLEPLLPPAPFAELDDEICYGLTCVPWRYTGGSHRSMGIVPPSAQGDAYGDYGEAIRAMTVKEFRVFATLADEPYPFDPERFRDEEFGEERDHPLSRRQMLYLELRYGVYFPWKVYYELLPNRWWDEKSSGAGKDFSREAQRYFPKTVAFCRSLSFAEVGSCKLLGLQANDHGTIHRDRDPATSPEPDHCITFCPRGNKRLFLWDEEDRTKTFVSSRIYWFNDADYHGVEADPFFRYSIRVDGVFRPEFLDVLRSRIPAPREPGPPASGA
jgi:hypothetical protein